MVREMTTPQGQTKGKGKGKGKSKYAAKAGKQMYGPGCCAHRKPQNHMQEEVEELRRTHPNQKNLRGSYLR